MYVGAFDPDTWNGIVFDGTAYGQRVPFAMRVGSKSGRFLDGERIFDAVSTVGPHAPDGSYALLSWRHYPRTAPVTLEWSRIDRTTVVGRLRAPADMHLVLEAYSPFELDFTGAYYISRDGNQIIGDHHIDCHFTSAAHFVVATDRPIVGTATFPKVAELRQVMDVGTLTDTDARNKKGAVALESSVNDSYADDRPAAYHAMLGLESFVSKSSKLEGSLLELIKMRASQINGCAFSIDMHSKDARMNGETEQRLYALSAWRETTFFTNRERAALAWTEALTLITEGRAPDEVYAEVREECGEEELVNLSLAIITINGWNRFAIGVRKLAGEYQPHEID